MDVFALISRYFDTRRVVSRRRGKRVRDLFSSIAQLAAWSLCEISNRCATLFFSSATIILGCRAFRFLRSPSDAFFAGYPNASL